MEKNIWNRTEWNIQSISEAMDIVSVNSMMGGVTQGSFRCGENQIDIQGHTYEPGWEMFAGSVEVRENGRLLFDRDACSVDNYHQESYTIGQFSKLTDVQSYLSDKYQNQPFEVVSEPVPKVQERFDRVWDSSAYQKQVEQEHSGTQQSKPSLTRIVFADKGLEKGYHKIDFAYACDQKTFGQDKSMGNPYLMSSKRKDAQGKLTTVHAYYLSDSIYQRLQKFANTDNLSPQSRWSGVVEGMVGYPASRNGKTQPSLNLTRDAEAQGLLRKPDVPFDERNHDKFVKASLAEQRENRAKNLDAQYGARLDAPQAESQTLSK